MSGRNVWVVVMCSGIVLGSACKSSLLASGDASGDGVMEGGSAKDEADGTSPCSYADGAGPVDGDAPRAGCPSSGCPAGSVCVEEIGAVNTGQACVPIPLECHGTASCACMAGCACIYSVGRLPESCTESPGFITCDNRTRN